MSSNFLNTLYSKYMYKITNSNILLSEEVLWIKASESLEWKLFFSCTANIFRDSYIAEMTDGLALKTLFLLRIEIDNFFSFEGLFRANSP